MRVAVTGSTGRLGRALVTALSDAPFTGPGGPIAWTRADMDLDAPEGVTVALDRDRPDVVIHTAAWTDVDGCARDPELAALRNGRAVGSLADACAARGLDLLLISTNEVFDGGRADGLGYAPDDPPAPANPYGASKLAGETAATQAYAAVARGSGGGATATSAGVLGIARTAWLFGPPGRDFPRKIAEAAIRATTTGEPLRVVADEYGTPTYAPDVAEAICELLAEDALGGIHHLVNGGISSRADWARDILIRLDIRADVADVPGSTWKRASSPPAWGVLTPTPLPSGEPIRTWQMAMADYAPTLRRLLHAGAHA